MSDLNATPALALAVAIVLLTVVGCGGVVGPTEGLVRFADGTPVTSGSIEFRSLSDKQRYASRIAIDGSFHPANQDEEIGLPAGSYEIVVVQIVMTEDLAKEAHSHGNTVPRRYADYYTSGLEIEIPQDQTKPIEIVIAQDSDGQ
ncbi:carboxypeptidase regulatory-like domain-containing protein [Stieleria varia]|uniref:Carboxypeptidase regulatory-like domain-containing protein n=1 Tax=Stieleria varia TaxID=2528005 RepID=A0A5C6A6N1_9BACT|nr:carboxypeptidase regulatory-like domain-containing protein [Stieleria varia]TWT94731.1 hypothetical protein Pla52n_55560 [Stieleria varia]